MKRMLINAREEGESRVAVLADGRLDEFFVERASLKQILANIYTGRVANIERGIQAAFLDIGLQGHGFLHFSDAIYPLVKTHKARGKKKSAHPRIQDILKAGKKVLVQVIKEESGTKGPALTTNISLPGRYVVFMPFWPKKGLSRKIADGKERERLSKIIDTLKVPDGMGMIVRTAGLGLRKSDFQRDLNYLQRLWNTVQRRWKESDKPGLIYKDNELVIRTLRDILSPDIGEVIIDHKDIFRRAQDFMKIVAPRQKRVLRLHEAKEPIFHKFDVESQIEGIFDRTVPLPSGGSVVIDQTEAFVAVDVNSGKYRKGQSVEETALKINTEAAEEIARQIRLRDLGGLIIIDFIDMKEPRNRRAVEKTLRKAIGPDRARNKILRMSEFCLVEMTRRRLKSSLRVAHFDSCPVCRGTGFVLSDESVCLKLLRMIRHAVGRPRAHRIEVTADPGVAHRLLNDMRAEICDLEDRLRRKIEIRASVDAPKGSGEIALFDAEGKTVEGS
jgi:ribonuclease E